MSAPRRWEAACASLLKFNQVEKLDQEPLFAPEDHLGRTASTVAID
jgi:hypothetical protein